MTDTPTGPRSEHTFAGGAVRLGGRYEIGDLLGRGGMADVRVGRDLRLGRTVAIKRLRTDLASDPTFLARFRREAQSAAALNHPAIVAVYDTGEAGGADGDTAPYIVMEYVEGQTIREIMHDGRKLLPQRALELTAEILGALDYSHRAGIVHRDIKPGNVMLTPAGQVKVMDFGIARAIADASSAMTQTAAVVGTAQYLSPEQARGEQVDARSDIYSTGCLLFELLVGRPPFVGDSPVSVVPARARGTRRTVDDQPRGDAGDGRHRGSCAGQAGRGQVPERRRHARRHRARHRRAVGDHAGRECAGVRR
jgi:serine/threonine-protein kinase